MNSDEAEKIARMFNPHGNRKGIGNPVVTEIRYHAVRARQATHGKFFSKDEEERLVSVALRPDFLREMMTETDARIQNFNTPFNDAVERDSKRALQLMATVRDEAEKLRKNNRVRDYLLRLGDLLIWENDDAIAERIFEAYDFGPDDAPSAEQVKLERNRIKKVLAEY